MNDEKGGYPSGDTPASQLPPPPSTATRRGAPVGSDGERLGLTPWRLAAAASEAEQRVPGCRLVVAIVPEIDQICMCIFAGDMYRGYLNLATGEVVLENRPRIFEKGASGGEEANTGGS